MVDEDGCCVSCGADAVIVDGETLEPEQVPAPSSGEEPLDERLVREYERAGVCDVGEIPIRDPAPAPAPSSGHEYVAPEVGYSDGIPDSCQHETVSEHGYRVCGRKREDHAPAPAPKCPCHCHAPGQAHVSVGCVCDCSVGGGA